MSSLSSKDRVSLCQFTFSDGRRCRTPRTGKNPHFCFDHAQKEARARTAETLGRDLAYFFSGDYLSACDLSSALGRLIPAVLRGDVKPRTARTVAYLAQTLLQTIHLSEQEYINAFGTNGWRQSIRDSVNDNHDYLFPPAPHRSGGLQAGPAPQPGHSCEPPPQPQSAQPSQAQPAVSQPAQTPVNCHSDAVAEAFRPEEPAFSSRPSTPPKATPSSPSAPLTPTGATSPVSPQPQAQPPGSPSACPEQGRRVNPLQSRASTPQSGPSRDTPWWEFGEAGRIPPDSKLL